MRQESNNRDGFSVAEVVIVVALLGILTSVVWLNLGASGVHSRERELQINLEALRTAIDLYRAEHGRWPCSQGDYNYPCSDEELENKLTRYTRADGRTSPTRNDQYRFGPYLRRIPVEPFSQTDSLTWSLGTQRLKESIASQIDEGHGNGGWYYEPESGNVVPNLGAAFPREYARF